MFDIIQILIQSLFGSNSNNLFQNIQSQNGENFEKILVDVLKDILKQTQSSSQLEEVLKKIINQNQNNGKILIDLDDLKKLISYLQGKEFIGGAEEQEGDENEKENKKESKGNNEILLANLSYAVVNQTNQPNSNQTDQPNVNQTDQPSANQTNQLNLKSTDLQNTNQPNLKLPDLQNVDENFVSDSKSNQKTFDVIQKLEKSFEQKMQNVGDVSRNKENLSQIGDLSQNKENLSPVTFGKDAGEVKNISDDINNNIAKNKVIDFSSNKVIEPTKSAGDKVIESPHPENIEMHPEKKYEKRRLENLIDDIFKNQATETVKKSDLQSSGNLSDFQHTKSEHFVRPDLKFENHIREVSSDVEVSNSQSHISQKIDEIKRVILEAVRLNEGTFQKRAYVEANIFGSKVILDVSVDPLRNVSVSISTQDQALKAEISKHQDELKKFFQDNNLNLQDLNVGGRFDENMGRENFVGYNRNLNFYGGNFVEPKYEEKISHGILFANVKGRINLVV
jgi:hypothetical protein